MEAYGCLDAERTEETKASLIGGNISPSYWKEKEIHSQQSEHYIQMYMCQSFGIVWRTWASVSKPIHRSVG